MSRFFLYARKSSESEDRQILSIESQVRELTAFARAHGHTIVRTFSEARSAKAPGRPIFGEMLQAITKGQADGILCWKLDRLARNPVDGAALIWALDEGRLSEIVTRDRIFTNTGDDKFWMQLEFGMAKKYVDDLSDNVKRGNRAKLEQGWLPGIPPTGYMNDLGTKTIAPDPARFDLVRRMWDFVLAGRPPREVLRIANEEWGLRSRKTRRNGGTPLAKSNFYSMLADPFYYGLIIRKGDAYPGAHKPMITRDEFDRVQTLLGRPNRAQRSHDFAFRGLIHCGECGCTVTPEAKVNRQGHHYIYYHCTKRKAGPRCAQRSIRAEALEAQILAALKQISIDDEFTTWAHDRLTMTRERSTAAVRTMTQSLDAALRANEQQIRKLIQMRYRDSISDQQFVAEKTDLMNEQINLKSSLANADQKSDVWFEPSETTLAYANLAAKRFPTAPAHEKREIVLTLGSNLLLKDRILRIRLKKPFALMAEGVSPARWQALADTFRTFFTEHPTAIQWPQFCQEVTSPKVSRAG